MASANPLRIWLLTDGRRGHEQQAQGVVRLLGEFGPIQLETVVAQPHKRALLRLFGRRAPVAVLPWLYRRWQLPEGRPDLIVSAGGDTTLANVVLARHLAVPNIFCGSRRRFAADAFFLLLTRERQADHVANLVLKLSPLLYGRRDIRAAAAAWRQQHPGIEQPIWTLLIGGNGAGLDYQTADWLQLADAMQQLSQQHGVRWCLSSSPRTGAAVEKLLQQSIPAALLIDAIWFSAEPQRALLPLLGAAEHIVCTADSMSMLNQAVAAGVPVTAIKPASFAADERYRAQLASLARDFGVQCLAIAELANLPVSATMETVDPDQQLREELPVRLRRVGIQLPPLSDAHQPNTPPSTTPQFSIRK